MGSEPLDAVSRINIAKDCVSTAIKELAEISIIGCKGSERYTENGIKQAREAMIQMIDVRDMLSALQ